MKPFTTATIFLLVAIAFGHAIRVVNEWQVMVAGRMVPMWVSVVGIIIPAALAALVWREQRRP